VLLFSPTAPPQRRKKKDTLTYRPTRGGGEGRGDEDAHDRLCHPHRTPHRGREGERCKRLDYFFQPLGQSGGGGKKNAYRSLTWRLIVGALKGIDPRIVRLLCGYVAAKEKKRRGSKKKTESSLSGLSWCRLRIRREVDPIIAT